jgi:Ecdysteroid kinase-like family
VIEDRQQTIEILTFGVALFNEKSNHAITAEKGCHAQKKKFRCERDDTTRRHAHIYKQANTETDTVSLLNNTLRTQYRTHTHTHIHAAKFPAGYTYLIVVLFSCFLPHTHKAFWDFENVAFLCDFFTFFPVNFSSQKKYKATTNKPKHTHRYSTIYSATTFVDFFLFWLLSFLCLLTHSKLHQCGVFEFSSCFMADSDELLELALSGSGSFTASQATGIRQSIVQSLWANYGKVINITYNLPTQQSESETTDSKSSKRRSQRLAQAQATSKSKSKSKSKSSTTTSKKSRAASKRHSIMAKVVQPPSGSATDISHQRKLHSYQVECGFYSEFAPVLLQFASDNDLHIAIPTPLHVSYDHATHKAILVLTDLCSSYTQRHAGYNSYTMKQTETCLDWLAGLHACFWGREAKQIAESKDPTALPTGCWRHGCYWHLETRPDEYSETDTSTPLGRALKKNAHAIDLMLAGYTLEQAQLILAADNRRQRTGTGNWSTLWHEGKHSDRNSSSGSKQIKRDVRFRTLCHGDFKPANMLFAADDSSIGVYDFQYVGFGFGAKDIAYLFMVAVGDEVVGSIAKETQALRYYYDSLMSILRSDEDGKYYSQDDVNAYKFSVFQFHFKLAVLDLYRFMSGWGYWGNDEWAEDRCKRWIVDIFGESVLLN